jgi:hypothetical protein
MTVNKVSNTDIRQDLCEAQQYKCENRCVNCFKLQSELREVRLELKSVKEIMNILNRDLASFNVRLLNLQHEQLSHIATQSFENWPSRPSTKKSYSELTANKPYNETKNCFQLLEYLQENDSPVDVPSELPQPGMDYRSAVRVRNACVQGEHQVMKYAGKTHFHNTNLKNSDTKNYYTIPVIVKGQALTSKSNPVKRQSSKSFHRKDHKVLIIGDSHTRLCATNVKVEIKDKYDVQGLVKPGAGILANTANSDITNLT